MKPAPDSAVNRVAPSGVGRYTHRPRGAVLLVVLVASLAALLPNAAHAHDFGHGRHEDDGGHVGGALVRPTPDGYDEPFRLSGRTYEIDGKGFIFGEPVRIFQCGVTGTVNLHRDCQLLDVAPVNLWGEVATTVYMRQSFSNVNAPYNPLLITQAPFGTEVGGVTCLGRLGVQCAVVAAQFSSETNQIVRRAEHYICFGGQESTHPTNPTLCQAKPTASPYST